jgi:hypothetical protein
VTALSPSVVPTLVLDAFPYTVPQPSKGEARVPTGRGVQLYLDDAFVGFYIFPILRVLTF